MHIHCKLSQELNAGWNNYFKLGTMAKSKEKRGFFVKAETEFSKTEKALGKAAMKIIAKTKKNNSYLVIADKNGKVKKIPFKDL